MFHGILQHGFNHRFPATFKECLHTSVEFKLERGDCNRCFNKIYRKIFSNIIIQTLDQNMSANKTKITGLLRPLFFTLKAIDEDSFRFLTLCALSFAAVVPLEPPAKKCRLV